MAEGAEAMAFAVILEKLEQQEKGLRALLPLLEKILAHLEVHAQQPEVPVATWDQLYPDVQEAAPTCEPAPSVPVDGTSLPRPRGVVWRWFHEEKAS